MDGGINIQNTTSSHYINVPSKKPYIKNKDPYSIYDDDSSATHYFLVPPVKDPQKFTRAFQELNKIGNKPSICRPSTSPCSSGYINERNLRRSQSQRTRTKSCSQIEKHTNTTRHFRTTNNSHHKIPPPPPKRYDSDEDEYCTIKVDSPNEFHPSNRPCILSSANTRIKKQYIKREHLPELTPILKKTQEFGDENDCCKTKTQIHDPDRYIDICTCMLCVRSVSYKCSGKNLEEEKYSTEPCSCKNQTTSSKSVGRYVCMGLMAVFLPCMLCYLPAKACSRNRKSKHKHYSDDTLVCYQTNNNKPL